MNQCICTTANGTQCSRTPKSDGKDPRFCSQHQSCIKVTMIRGYPPVFTTIWTASDKTLQSNLNLNK